LGSGRLFESFWGIVFNVVVVVGVVATVAGVALAIWIHVRNGLIERLNSHPDRVAIKRELGETPGFERYQHRMRQLNGWLENFFGSPWKWRAFYRTLAIALVYPLLAYVLSWTVGADDTFAGYRMMPEIEPAALKIMVVILALLMCAAFAYFFYNMHRMSYGVARWLDRRLVWPERGINSNLENFIAFTCYFVLCGVLTAVVFAPIFAGTLAVAGILAAAFAFGMFGSIFVANAGPFVVVSTLLIVAVGTSSIAIADNSASARSCWLSFFALLPLLNAFADWLSWGATRFFIGRVVLIHERRRRIWRLTIDLVLDFVVALLCLVLLAGLLANGMELANRGSAAAGWPTIPWQLYLGYAVTEPFGRGLMVTLMLATTLFPTILHLGVAAAGLFWTIRWYAAHASQMAEAIPEGEVDRIG
jgi:hypothetical protein